MAIIDVFPLGAGVASTAGGGGATTGLVNRKLHDGVTGTPTYAAHPDGLAQHTAQRINAVTTHSNIQTGNAPSKIAVGFSVWGVTTPVTGAFQYVSIVNSGGARPHMRWNTTGAFQANCTGGTIIDVIPSVTTGRRYWVDALFDVSGTTWTIDTYVDGVQTAQASFSGQTAQTISNVTAGNPNAAGTSDGYLSDVVVYDAADWPIGPCWVFDMIPTASGTHSSTAGDFTDDASAAVNVGETTSWQKVDEWPPNTTDFVRQAVSRSTSYLEYVLQALPAGYQARFFKLVGANAPAGTTALEMGLRLWDGASQSAEAVIDASVATSTLEYHCHGYTAAPNGEPWSNRARIDNARPRIGFSTDISPLFNFSAVLGQVVAQPLVPDVYTARTRT